MAKITKIGFLSLVKSAIFIGKTGPHFLCLDIAAMFTLPAAKCQGERCLTSTALPVSGIRFLTSDAPTDITLGCYPVEYWHGRSVNHYAAEPHGHWTTVGSFHN